MFIFAQVINYLRAGCFYFNFTSVTRQKKIKNSEQKNGGEKI